MQHRLLPRAITIIIAGAMSFMLITARASPADSSHKFPLPYMWSAKSIVETEHYKNDRKKIMETEYANQPDGFLLKGWLNMIAYFKQQYPTYNCLRTYICAYTSGTNVPQGQENKLVLVFVPAHVTGSTSTELGYYRFIGSDSFTSASANRFTVTQHDLQTWSSNYFDHFLKYLSDDIDQNNPWNRNKNDKYTDTWCLSYCSTVVEELLTEKGYIHVDNPGVNGINISENMLFTFASHPDIYPGDGTKKAGRLFLVFDFTDYSNNAVFLDDMFKFRLRTLSNASCNSCGGPHVLNNGQLCPPASNCP